MSEDLRGKVVVITGASSGFGKGVARELAGCGASLVLAARRAELLEELARECEGKGAQALAVPTDVSLPEEMEALGQAAVSRFGRIDVWLNNAGVGALGRFEDVPLEDHAQVVATNLLGTIYGSYFALRTFRHQGGGTLINIASVVGKIPAPYYGSYTASKFGVVGLSATLRQELEVEKAEGIHVCTVMPMSNDTPFFDHVANYTGHEAQPIPPLYDPQEVVETVVRLMTRPEDEVVVGAAGKMMVKAHEMTPGAVEGMMARQTHQAQMEKSPPAAETDGSVLEPEEEGTEVVAGRLERSHRTERPSRESHSSVSSATRWAEVPPATPPEGLP